MEEPAPGENKRIKFCRVFHCDSFHSQGDCVRVFVATGRLIVLVSKDILDLHSVNMTRMDKFLHPLPVTRQRSTSVMPSHEINCMVIAGSHHSQYCWILQSHVSEEEKFVIHIDLHRIHRAPTLHLLDHFVPQTIHIT